MSVFLEDLKTGLEIITEVDECCWDWVLEGIIVPEVEGKDYLLHFVDPDSQLWRPIMRVNLKERTTEYIPDPV